LTAFAQLYPGEDWAIAKTRLLQAMPRASAVMQAIEPQTYAEKDSWLKSARDESVPITPASLAERTIELMERKHPGKQLMFVVDEVGQYVARDIQKMLDLQAIVQQLGMKGRGKVWVMVTSQEKLSDVVGYLDDNRTELARLQDRFPYKPVLEPSDIAEVTSRRVLGKNSPGEQTLQGCSSSTRAAWPPTPSSTPRSGLPELTSKAFADLYPLLPYQIELIIQVVSGLRLSGGASKQFGGANRAIIKLAQELLTNPQSGLADEAGGCAGDAGSGLRPAEQQHRFAVPRQDQRYRHQGRATRWRCRWPRRSACCSSSIRCRQLSAMSPWCCTPAMDGDSLESQVQEACRHLEERNLIRKAATAPTRSPPRKRRTGSRPATSRRPRPRIAQPAGRRPCARTGIPCPAPPGQWREELQGCPALPRQRVVKGDVPVKVERVDGSEASKSGWSSCASTSQQDTNTFFWALRPSPELDRALGEWFRSQKVIDLKGKGATGKGQVQLVSEERRKLEGFRQGRLPPGGSNPDPRQGAAQRRPCELPANPAAPWMRCARRSGGAGQDLRAL
jgi:hypothetical protein